MDNAFLDEGHEPVADLSKNVGGLVLAELRVGVDELLEVAVAYLLNDVVVMAALHDVEDPYNVFGLHQLQDLDL